MNFLTAAALAVGALVVLPLMAHLLRRRPPQEIRFAAARFVPALTAIQSRRTAIEDRLLFAVRSLAVLALAVLGATPLVTCNRLSLAREGGASVALTIVLDDSLSMRAQPGSMGEEEEATETTRFDRAKKAALELVAGLQDGDSVGVVLAGKPARVALASTTNIEAAAEVIRGAEQSDRGTELQEATQLAGELLRDLRHIDKRIVVLSDLAGGAEALTPPEGTKLWIPLEDLPGVRPDCAAVSAERTGSQVAVDIACAGPAGATAPDRRTVQLWAGQDMLLEKPFRTEPGEQSILLSLGNDTAVAATQQLEVRLAGRDALAVDDRVPVISIGGQLRVGVVSDTSKSTVATGGAPPIEQAFAALSLGLQVRPRSTVPDQRESLDELGLLFIDDVPGLTPTQRRELAAWVERGGVLVLSLGPTAAEAPLGQSFEPFIEGVIRWSPRAPAGVDRVSDRLLADAGDGFEALAPKGRTELSLNDPDSLQVLAKWTDGAPFALQKRIGRGLVLALTLPLQADQSDLVLRPGFLELLKQWVTTARTLGGVAETMVGSPWAWSGFSTVEAFYRVGGDRYEPIDVQVSPGGKTFRAIAERAGLYRLKLDGNETFRVATVDPREVDLAPRPAAPAQSDGSLGGVQASIDVSSYVALALLALFLAELVVRTWARRAAAAPVGEGDDRDDEAPPSAPAQAA